MKLVYKLFSYIEDGHINRRNLKLAKKNYTVGLIPYYCFGSQNLITVQMRASLVKNTAKLQVLRKGIFNFLIKQLPNLPIKLKINNEPIEGVFYTDRGGYLDCQIEHALIPGKHHIEFYIDPEFTVQNRSHQCTIKTPEEQQVACGDLYIYEDNEETIGIISDIDDTILISNAPSPFQALKNMLFVSPYKRKVVPGMCELYTHLVQKLPNSFFIYLSAGPWNQFRFLSRFIAVNKFPKAPIILQDIGPDMDKLFESTKTHKSTKLTALFEQFPNVKWILIGDDGQFDLAIYKDVATRYPGRVKAIVMRQLTPSQQVLNSVVPFPIYQSPLALPLSISGAAGIQKFKAKTISVPIIYANNGKDMIELLDAIC